MVGKSRLEQAGDLFLISLPIGRWGLGGGGVHSCPFQPFIQHLFYSFSLRAAELLARSSAVYKLAALKSSERDERAPAAPLAAIWSRAPNTSSSPP